MGVFNMDDFLDVNFGLRDGSIIASSANSQESVAASGDQQILIGLAPGYTKYRIWHGHFADYCARIHYSA